MLQFNLFPGSSAVERRTVNPNVVGSIPARGAILEVKMKTNTCLINFAQLVAAK